MGRKGGFRLSKDPSNISLLEVVKAIQGPVRLNRCLSGYGLALRRDELGKGICPQQRKCKVRMRLIELEQFINSYLDSITLDEIVKSKGQRIKGKRDKRRKK